MAKKAAKKTAKKAVAKKSSVKKKAVAKKSVAKKSVAKKSTVKKKTAVKKTVPKKPAKKIAKKTTKKVSAKKTTTKSKAVTKKAPVKSKTTAKKKIAPEVVIVAPEIIRKKPTLPDHELTKLVVEGMQEKKAQDIAIIDLRNTKGSVADFFVVCGANSDTQVDAIADSVEEIVYKNIKSNPWHKEGIQNKEWIVLDYVDVVAHVFRKDRREFYALEALWGDANIVRIED